jgi:hypothetical protein
MANWQNGVLLCESDFISIPSRNFSTAEDRQTLSLIQDYLFLSPSDYLYIHESCPNREIVN